MIGHLSFQKFFIFIFMKNFLILTELFIQIPNSSKFFFAGTLDYYLSLPHNKKKFFITPLANPDVYYLNCWPVFPKIHYQFFFQLLAYAPVLL